MSLSKRVPPSLKSQQHMWAISFDFDKRAPLTCYYIRLMVQLEVFESQQKIYHLDQFYHLNQFYHFFLFQNHQFQTLPPLIPRINENRQILARSETLHHLSNGQP